MIVIQRIAKNIGLFYAAQLISYIFSFFYVMYTARYLGAQGFGILSFALAFTGIFGILSDLGLRRVTTREVARDKSLTKTYLGNIAAIKIILTIATFALIALSINLLNYPVNTKKIVYIVGLSVIFNAFSQLFYAVFQAHEKMEYESLGRILNNVLLFTGALFVINKGLTVSAFAVLYLLVSMVIFAYGLFISMSRFSLPRLELNWNFWRITISEALPFGLIGVFEIIYHWIDTVMLSAMQGDTVVGWYNAAYRLFMFTLFIPSAVNMAIFPVMSRYYRQSENKLKLLHQKYFKYMSAIGIFIAVSMILFAEKIILLIYGDGFRPSIIALQILICSSVLIYMNGAFVRLFESINKQKKITKIAGAAAVFNVLLNLLLIPRYSYIGASTATVLSELLILASVLIMTSKTRFKIKSSVIVKQFSQVSAAGITMGLMGYIFNNYNMFITIIPLTLIYFGTFYLIGGFDRDDLVMAKKILLKA